MLCYERGVYVRQNERYVDDDARAKHTVTQTAARCVSIMTAWQGFRLSVMFGHVWCSARERKRESSHVCVWRALTQATAYWG